MKRLLDLSCLAAGCFLFGPIAFVLAVLIKLDDRGNVLFTQERIGAGGRPFRIFKFRTMEAGRVTRMGRLLRPCGLDELPQLLNVLKGDMSIVGPRPLTQFDIDRLGWGDDRDRWRVRPGLTGLAQIYGGMGARHSVRLDNLYGRKSGLFVDLWIICLSLAMNFLGKHRVRRWISPAFRRLTAKAGRRLTAAGAR